ncbi:MAG: sortase [Chloroflexi bacterium]|nr:sortase [Chloroflexota bacterium]MCH8221789.1 sortase [Chloroflexota bacterium]
MAATTTTNHSSRRFPIGRMHIAVLILVIGALMAGAGGIYLAVTEKALSTLDDFVVEVPGEVQQAWVAPPVGRAAPTVAPVVSGDQPAPESTIVATAAVTDELPGEISFNFGAVYPADQTNPRFWSNPEFAGTGPYGGSDLPEGFEFVSALDALRGADGKNEALRIKIPSIGVDEPVGELQILEEASGLRYEQPVGLVGHIPDTPDPGQIGNGWYFGHLESPILGEGNVFRRLPDIAELIKQDPVNVILETATEAFLYRVTGTTIVPKEDLALTPAPTASITLVASFPSPVYSHRFLVTAELLAARSLR